MSGLPEGVRIEAEEETGFPCCGGIHGHTSTAPTQAAPHSAANGPNPTAANASTTKDITGGHQYPEQT